MDEKVVKQNSHSSSKEWLFNFTQRYEKLLPFDE